MAGSLIGMDKALAGGAVNHRNSGFKSGFRLGFIPGVDGFDDLFDIRAHPGTDAGVLLTMLFRLTDTLFCLSSIGQDNNPISLLQGKALILILSLKRCNHTQKT